MKIKELKLISEKELKNKLVELKTELIKERAQVATGTVSKNPGKINLAKKTIARIETLLTQKQKEENKA